MLLVLQAAFLLIFDVLFLKQVLYIFSTQMWPEIKVSRVPREVEHPVTLFDIYFTKKSEFKCFKLVYSLCLKYCS